MDEPCSLFHDIHVPDVLPDCTIGTSIAMAEDITAIPPLRQYSLLLSCSNTEGVMRYVVII